MNASRGTSLGWLGHPLSVVALLVLVVNDHVLKAAYPGRVTGKLSDAAGLVFAPPLLAVTVALLAPRLRARWVTLGAIGVVGVGFVVVKASAHGARLASAAWSVVTPSLIRADLSDLVVLPCLGLAWWSLGRAGRESQVRWAGSVRVFRSCGQLAVSPDGRVKRRGTVSEPTQRRTGEKPVPRLGGRAPGAGRVVRALRVAVLLPLALVGVAATSPARSDAAERVAVVDGALYLGAEAKYASAWAVSADGGVSWSAVAAPRVAELRLDAVEPQRQACSTGGTGVCYRVVPSALAVEVGRDGGAWSDSWRIGEADRRALYRAYGDLESMDAQLSSRSVAVRDVAGGGYVVVVANGRDGFALRGVDGAWRRIGFPAMPGVGTDAPYDLGAAGRLVLPVERWFVAAWVIFGIGVLLTGAGAGSTRRAGGGPHWWWVLVAQVGVAGFALSMAAVGVVQPSSMLAVFTWGSPYVVGLVSVTGLLVVLVAGGTRIARRVRWFAWLAVAGLVAGAAPAAAWVLWSRAAPGRTGVLFWSLVLAWVVGLVPAVVAVRSAGPVEPVRDDPPYPDVPAVTR